jgi:hypothetical protein
MCDHNIDPCFLPTISVRLFPISNAYKHFSLVLRVLSRVTRLGKFSPNGQLFTLGRFFLITEVAQNFGLLFPLYRMLINFDKKWVGLHLRLFCHKLIWSPWCWVHFKLRKQSYLMNGRNVCTYLVAVLVSNTFCSAPSRDYNIDKNVQLTRGTFLGANTTR